MAASKQMLLRGRVLQECMQPLMVAMLSFYLSSAFTSHYTDALPHAGGNTSQARKQQCRPWPDYQTQRWCPQEATD